MDGWLEELLVVWMGGCRGCYLVGGVVGGVVNWFDVWFEGLIDGWMGGWRNF